MRMDVFKAVSYIPENSNLLLYAVSRSVDMSIKKLNVHYVTILYLSVGKRKVSPCLCHEGMQGEQRYISTVCNHGPNEGKKVLS